MNKKILISVGAIVFLVVDWVAFFIPLGASLFLFVVAMRPRWFYDLVQEIYRD